MVSRVDPITLEVFRNRLASVRFVTKPASIRIAGMFDKKSTSTGHFLAPRS